MNADANQKAAGRIGFTLIELLVVIAIIGILSSLLLPSIARSKQKARLSQCLSNLRQIGIGLALYTHDSQDYFPSGWVQETNGESKEVTLAVGGFNPDPTEFPCLPTAEIRPLYPYIKPGDVFHCPSDHGLMLASCVRGCQPDRAFTPTCWETAGCSYVYNCGLGMYYSSLTKLALVGVYTKFPVESLLAGQKSPLIPNPSCFISMYEPPATAWSCNLGSGTYFTHWHYEGNRKETTEPNIQDDGDRFISPILFVDGHSKIHDFTAMIQAAPYYANEATGDWIWYQPKQ